MTSDRQQAYLEAMDISVWRLRNAAVAEAVLPETPEAIKAQGLKLGPGGGGILLVCGVDSDSASRLASDIGRAMGSNPVWAWPFTDAAATLTPK